MKTKYPESLRKKYERAMLRESGESRQTFVGIQWTTQEAEYLRRMGRTARVLNFIFPQILAYDEEFDQLRRCCKKRPYNVSTLPEIVQPDASCAVKLGCLAAKRGFSRNKLSMRTK